MEASTVSSMDGVKTTGSAGGGAALTPSEAVCLAFALSSVSPSSPVEVGANTIGVVEGGVGGG